MQGFFKEVIIAKYILTNYIIEPKHKVYFWYMLGKKGIDWAVF